MSQLCVGQESKYKLCFAAMCLEHVQHEAHSCKRKYVLACHTIGERTVCCGLKLDYAPWEMPCWGAESFALQWTVTELMHQNHNLHSFLKPAVVPWHWKLVSKNSAGTSITWGYICKVPLPCKLVCASALTLVSIYSGVCNGT